MARTHNKHLRAYMDGVDISGYVRNVGAMSWMFGSESDAAITDGCKNVLIGQPDIQMGAYSAFLDTAATMPPTLGGNVIVNGTFASDANWTKGTNWTISSTAIATAVTSGTLTAIVPPLVVGKTYLITYTATVTSGDVAVKDGVTTGTTRSASGTYEEIFTAGATAFIFFSPSGGFTGTIDNVSAQEYKTGRNADSGKRDIMVAVGLNAAPAAGNPVFAWTFEQTGYSYEQGSGFVAMSIPFGGTSYAAPLNYSRPWGNLLFPYATRTSATGVNTGIGIDDIGGTSALGGIFVYHLASSNGTLTLCAEDANGTNIDGDFADSTLDTVATSGVIDASVIPKHGMIQLATNRAIRRYIRWQVAFGTATTATFTVAFIRNNLAV